MRICTRCGRPFWASHMGQKVCRSCSKGPETFPPGVPNL